MTSAIRVVFLKSPVSTVSSTMSSTDYNPLQPQNVSVPEMGRFQRQVVDNSLEEGQFQSGIDALDQLRSPDHKPSVYATVSYH